MGRYYHFSKSVTKTESSKIIQEMKKLEDIKSVEVTDDGSCLKVQTKDDEFAEVMGKAVNICSKMSQGLEISFYRFAAEECVCSGEKK